MKKHVKILSLFVAVAMFVSMSSMSFAANEVIAKYTSSKIMVDNVEVSFEAYNIGGSNYFKLRDIAYQFSPQDAFFSPYYGFEVIWDGKLNAINIIKSGDWDDSMYTPVGGELAKGDGKDKKAVPCNSSIYLNGKPISLTAYNINGNNYFKLRDLAKELDFAVDWDEENKTVIVCSYMSQEFYDEIKEEQKQFESLF